MLTTADQNYIKAIYRLQLGNEAVSTSALAAALGVTPASVSGMLRKLSRSNVLIHQRYKGVRLTARGRLAALQVIRRHRLIELFLVEILGLPWDSVHKEAERLEHVVSDEILERMDVLLGHPAVDPHGAPIPSHNGRIASHAGVRLAELDAGARGTVSEVADHDPDLLRYLSDIRLTPGAEVAVIDRLPFDGTVVITVSGRQQHVSAGVASAVWIETT
ncbi:MAG: metal-dependent transcriptional regulator [candidate division Zixibacteria bacterium]|nr:metal-dependent transcriptional regulator [candidate division Zixibacteria bacterium]